MLTRQTFYQRQRTWQTQQLNVRNGSPPDDFRTANPMSAMRVGSGRSLWTTPGRQLGVESGHSSERPRGHLRRPASECSWSLTWPLSSALRTDTLASGEVASQFQRARASLTVLLSQTPQKRLRRISGHHRSIRRSKSQSPALVALRLSKRLVWVMCSKD